MRVLVAAIGSLGDLNPHLALALALRDRGHEATLATSEVFRPRVEALGLPFLPMPPDVPDWRGRPDLVTAMMDARRGTERVIREFALPALRTGYEAALPEVCRSDAVVSGLLAFGARLASEQRGVPWFSTALQPSVMFSLEDPPMLAGLPGASLLPRAPDIVRRGAFRAMHMVADRWTLPIAAFRQDLGLPPNLANPLLRGQHSPLASFALFSPLFAQRQLDWPASALMCGFPFDARVDDGDLPADLAEFLDAGSAPLLFTLGSAASLAPGDFVDQSVRAAQAVGMRSVVLAGPDALRGPLAGRPDVWIEPWLAHAAIFPRAVAVVHQGGIGTLSHALAAGRPMLVVPHSHDQPDNARRAAALGVARVLPRSLYRADRVAQDLRALLADAGYRARAEILARPIGDERGASVAAAAVERMIDER